MKTIPASPVTLQWRSVLRFFTPRAHLMPPTKAGVVRFFPKIACGIAGVCACLTAGSVLAADLPVQDGLIVWLKADAINPADTAQVRLSGSDIYVKSWVDSSGNNRPASNTTDNDQPMYIAGALNGQPVLRFAQDNDDNGDRLYLGDLGLYAANAGTIFVAATIDNDGRYNLFGNRSNDERWVADTWTESKPGSFRSARASGTFYPGAWPTTGSHVFALESDRSIYRMLIDGIEIGSDTPDYNSGSGRNWTIGNRSTDGQQLRGDIAEVIIYNHTLTADEANKVGKYLHDKYALLTAYVDAAPAPQAKMYDFSLPGTPFMINGLNITLTVPFQTDVTALAPAFMLSAGATCDKPSGSVQNFTTPQTYTVVSSDLAITNIYTVTVTVRPPTIAFNFNTGLQGWTQIWPAAGNGNVFENGALGSGHDGGDTRFARSPEFNLHGLEDLTFQLRGGESPLTAPAVGPSAIPEIALNSAGFAGVALRDVELNTYVLSKRRSGSNDEWQNNSFTVTELAPYVGKRCTLDYIDYNKGGWGWTYLDNVAIPGYGTRVTLEVSDLGIVVGSNATLTVSIPEGFNASTAVTVYLTNSNPAALTIDGSGAVVTTLTYAAGGTFKKTLNLTGISVGQVQLTAACADLDNATVVPTVCPPLIGRWLSGAPSLAETSGFRAAGVHDGVAVGPNAGMLAFNAEVPPGCTGQSLDLRAGNVGVMITNSATTDGAYLNTYDDVIRNKFTIAFWAKGFPGDWAGWVSKRGEDGIGWQVRRMSGDPIAGFTMRGIDNDDGWGSTINVNDSKWHHYVGVWDQATGTRTLYIDGVLSHVVNNTLGQIMSLASSKHLGLGARQQGGTSASFENYFSGLLYDVRLYSYPLSLSEVRGLIPATVSLAGRSAVPVGGSTPLTVTIPSWANASSMVTVYLTNVQPTLLNVNGSGALVTALTFASGGPASQAVTVNGLGAGQATLSAGADGMASSSIALQVFVASATPGLIGHWLAGAPHLADLSGYTDGTHDGSFVGVTAAGVFGPDTPFGRPGQSLDLRGGGNIAVRINNTRVPDAAYQPTFDTAIATKFSVAFWAKGFPNEWAGWVTKEGEDGRGWQLRRWALNPYACFTIRGLASEDGTGSNINVNDTNWHHYVGVWDGETTGTRSLYIDGVLSHTINNNFGPMTMAPNAPMVFGARANQDNNYDGNRWVKCQLFDVRMYSTALSEPDVQNLVGAVLASPPALSLVSPSPNTNFLMLVVPPSVVATSDVSIVITSDNPAAAIPAGATAGALTVTLPVGGTNVATVAVQANGPGTARFTYACALLPVAGTTTVAVQQPNINGLVAYWNFDNQTLAETAGFQPAGMHDGTAVGTVAYVPGRTGGYALDLRAANTAVRVQNSAISDASYRSTFDAFLFNSPAGFSLSCWVKGMPASDWSSWIAKDGEAAGYAIRKAGGSDITFTLRNSGAPADANPSDDDPTAEAARITDELWHHLVAVYDPVQLQRRLYLDGVEVISITDSNLVSPATSSPLFFGARDSSGDPRFARVIVDEIRAYDKVLSVSEIAAQVGQPMITLTPGRWQPNVGDADLTATITVPAALVAAGAVNVTITSANPDVAFPVGGTGGSLVVNFPMGGANTATVAIYAAGVGSTVISGSSASSGVNGEIVVNAMATPTLIGQWFSGNPDLIETSGYRPGIHNGVAAGPNAGTLGFTVDVPPNFTGQSVNLSLGEIGVIVANTSNGDPGYQPTFDSEMNSKFSVAFWAKGMPGQWAGWVTKHGEGGKGWQIRRMGSDNIAGFTIRGISDEDGWGSGININNDNWHHYVGIWDQAAGTRKLYVDGVFSHVIYNNPSQSLAPAPASHLVFGGMQDDNGSFWGDRWVKCLLFDVRIYNAPISEARIQALTVGTLPTDPPVLTIQPWAGNQVRISWPAAYVGFWLHESSSLTGVWMPSTAPVGVEGSENAAYATVTSEPLFFRLIK